MPQRPHSLETRPAWNSPRVSFFARVDNEPIALERFRVPGRVIVVLLYVIVGGGGGGGGNEILQIDSWNQSRRQ